MSVSTQSPRAGPARWRLGRVLLDPAVLLLAGVFALLIGAVLWQQTRLQARLVEFTALEEAHRYTDAVREFRSLYTSEVVEVAQAHNIDVVADYDQGEKKGKAIPLPITLSMKLGNEMAKRESGGRTALYSGYPFRGKERQWQDRDQFAKDAWAALSENPDSPFHRFEDHDGKRWLRFATADRMRAQACVDCHNNHPDSPKHDWKLNDVRGVLEISLPLDRAMAQTSAHLRETLIVSFIIGGLCLVGLLIPILRLRRSSAQLEKRVQERTAQLAQTNMALQQSESRIRAVLETAQNAFVAIDSHSRIVEWNARAERTFGWKRDEVLGRRVDEVLIPERYRAAHRDGLARFLDRGEAPVFGRVLQVEALHRSGQEIPVEMTISPIDIGDGYLFAAFLRDIREALAVEQKLRDSEALYHSTVESLPLCVLRKDLQGRFTFANQASRRLLRRELPDIVGKTDFDFFPPALAQKYRRDDDRIVATGEMFEDVERHQTPEGKTIYVQVKKTALHDAAGRIVGVQATFWDVTQQKEAEDALRQSEKRFQQLADNIVEVFWITTADGAEMVYVSPAYEQIWGRTCQSLYENPHQWLECIHEKDRGRVAKAFIEKGPLGQFDETYRIIRPDGKVRWIHDRGFAVRDDSGRVYRIAGTAQDVTRRKRAEIALRRAKRQAEAANRAKDTFLANVSHEIRTPMNAIIGLTELVLATPVSTQQRQHLQTVVSSAESLLAIINDILDFSKIEAGKLELDEVRFDLGETLGDTLKSIAVKAHEKGLELTYGVRPDVPPLLVGDPVRLRQIMLNLVGNAIKFTSRGEIVVAVQCRERTDGQAVLEFSVTDTGIGIPADKQEAVFRPFVQADMSTTRQFGGTGLGLSISSRLAERMGGRMWVESEPGKGSTFRFTACFQVVPGEAPARHLAGRTTLRGLRILVVDDNASNRAVLEEMLRQWDMRPTLAAGADEALDILRSAAAGREPFALVVTDAQMPGRDGFGFVEQAIDGNLLGGAVVMMLTSGDRFGDLARCRELGIAAHLFKPIKPSELLDVIVDLFGMKLPSAEELQAVPPAAARPLRVLLAEDSPVNQRLAVGLLELHGHKTTVAGNGREAVAALDVPAGAECPFDLVLMDLQMPEMDGLQATAAIRAREEGTGRHVPIIALTAHAMKSDRDRCLAAGMDAYVSKPIRTRDLFAAMAEILPADAGAGAQPAAERSRPSMAATDDWPPAISGPVDWEAALAAAGGDRGLLAQVSAAFLDESPRRLADMRRAIDVKDFPLLRRSAHTLKSSLRILGVHEAFELALSLEQHGAEGRLDGAEALFADLSQRLAAIQEHVSAYLGAAGRH